MEYGIKNNRRGYVRIAGEPKFENEEQRKRNHGKFPVVLDPGLNRLTKTQFEHVKRKVAHWFRPGSSGAAVLEEVTPPAERPQQKPDGKKAA